MDNGLMLSELIDLLNEMYEEEGDMPVLCKGEVLCSEVFDAYASTIGKRDYALLSIIEPEDEGYPDPRDYAEPHIDYRY